jgi:hypothetical protein
MTGPTVRPGLVERVAEPIRAVIMSALEQCDMTSNSHDWIANEAMEEIRAALAASGIEEMRGALEALVEWAAAEERDDTGFELITRARAALPLADGMGGEG